MTKLNILIVGAGVSGLALAKQLLEQGHQCLIIEKNDCHRTGGAGIALPANAVAALELLGLKDKVLEHAQQVSDIIYAKPSGKILAKASLLVPPLNVQPFIALQRDKLHEILADGIENIRFNTEVTDLQNHDDKVKVCFSNDSDGAATEYFDLVIGADGLYSSVRNLLFPDLKLDNFDIFCCRWICQYPAKHLQPTYQLGARDVFMTYPIAEDKVYCYAHVAGKDSILKHSVDYQRTLKKAFKNYGGVAKEILQRLPMHNAIIASQLRSVPKPLFGKGKVVLIGDACSACSPMLQQGAACGFEDGIVLSALLKKFKPEMALKHYQDIRSERVKWIVQASDAPMKNLAEKTSFVKVLLRNFIIRRKGPFNVVGWKKLLAENPYQNLA